MTRSLRTLSATALLAWPLVYTWGPRVSDGGALAWLWPGVLLIAVASEAALAATGGTSVLVLLWRAGRHLWHADGTRWVLGAVILSRVAVLGVGLATASLVSIPDRAPAFGGPKLWSMSARWDAFWYLSVTVEGYHWNPEAGDQQNVAFFPAFPALMRVAGEMVTIPAHLTGDAQLLGTVGRTRLLLGGTLVSLIAFTAALLLLYQLIRLDAGRETARWGVAFAACLPFGFFFSVPYTESLFLLGLVGGVLAVRQGRWPLAFAWGLLLGLTRPNGFLMALPLGAMAFVDWRRGRLRLPRHLVPVAAAVLAPVLGLATHMAYLWHAVGDPLAWSHAQSAWGRTVSLTGLVDSRAEHISAAGITSYLGAYPYEAANTAMLLAALALGWCSRRLAWPYALLVGVALLPAILIDLPAMGRMTAPLFPVPVALAMLVPERARPATAAALLLLQMVAAWQFYAWRPLY